MATVKFNEKNFSEVEDYVSKALTAATEAKEIWGEHFDDLYYAFIDSGFLESLYKDAESQYYNLANLGYLVTYTAGDAAIGATIGSFVPGVGTAIGGIIGAVIGFFRGIYRALKNPSETKWSYDSKIVFEELLRRCDLGNEDNYIQATNVETMMQNVTASLYEFRNLINEFQTNYADFTDSATEAKVTVTTAGEDGMTVTGIESTVNIGGETITANASDLLNSFVTYNETVMNSRIEAQILSEKYGLDIDYYALVKGANTMVASQIKNHLYSHEFVNYLMDNKNYSSSNASGATRNLLNGYLNDEQFTGALSGALAVGGGLLGLQALVGAINKPAPSSGGTTPGGTTPGGTNPGGTNPGGTNPGGTNPGGTNPGGTNPGNTDPGEKDPGKNDPGEKDPGEKDPEEKKPVNEIKIPEIVENKLPEEIESIYKVDYDKLAREIFEFEGDYNKIMQDRADLITKVETQFDNGDFEPLRESLTKFGYSSAEVEVILGSKFLTSKAMLEGTQNAMLAQSATELAKADGVEDFASKYSDRPNFDDLSLTDPSENLTLKSDSKKVTDAYGKMKESREEYTSKVKEANEALVDVNESKKTMEELKAKYEKEYGEDTTEWPEDAAKEYSEAIEKYNESVENANAKVEELEDAQKAYEESNKAFEDAQKDYLTNGGDGETVHGAQTAEPGVTTDGVTGDVITPGGVTQGNVTTGVTSDGSTFTLDTEGVTVDGVGQINTASVQDPAIATVADGLSQEMINNAALLSQTEQILNSLKEDGAELKIEG